MYSLRSPFKSKSTDIGIFPFDSRARRGRMIFVLTASYLRPPKLSACPQGQARGCERHLDQRRTRYTLRIRMGNQCSKTRKVGLSDVVFSMLPYYGRCLTLCLSAVTTAVVPRPCDAGMTFAQAEGMPIPDLEPVAFRPHHITPRRVMSCDHGYPRLWNSPTPRLMKGTL